MSLSDLARASMGIPGLSYAVTRGENLARSKNLTLKD